MAGNRTALILVAVLVLIGAGYGYYSYMLKPATTALKSANDRKTAAESTLAQKNSQLADAQTVKNDYSTLATTIVSTVAIPRDRNEIIVTAQILDIARRSGAQIVLAGTASEGSSAPVDPTSPTPANQTGSFTMSYDMYGTYDQLVSFVKQLEEPVVVRNGSVYVRDRLINVTSFKLRPSQSAEGGEGTDDDVKLKLVKGGIYATIELELFYDASELSAEDAAASLDSSAASMGGTTPPADGSTPVDPNAPTNQTSSESNGTTIPAPTDQTASGS